MKQIHFSRKRRQLKALAERYQYFLTKQQEDNTIQVEKLVLKIRLLLKELMSVFSRTDLRKILGAAAIITGIAFTNPVSAQSFGPPQKNPFGIDSTNEIAIPAFADLDGDGDMDLLVGESNGSMEYFQNTGSASNPQFAARQMNPFGLVSVNEFAVPAFADLDGDGDLDLLAGEYGGAMQYFQNTGSASSPQFAAAQENPFGLVSTYYNSFPVFADLDGDGDMDLLVGEYYGAMQYFQNTGSATNPQFAAPVKNPFGLSSTYELAVADFADLDGDGDLDLLVGEYYGAMQYFQNTGSASNPQFAAPQMNPFGLVSVQDYALPKFADLDGDGDQDLLVGEYYGAMKYFENTSLVGLRQFSRSSQDVLFPNPAKDVIRIKTNRQITRVEIIDATGKLVSSINGPSQLVNVSSLNKGTYFMKLTDSKGLLETKSFQKQ
jgi:CO dehydrogenase/acetyl-CoA synthase epsilon subunit